MFRLAGELIALVFFFLLARAVVTAVIGMLQKASTPPAEQLHKDPVCGTFVASSTAVTRVSGRETLYFCSDKCSREWKR